MVDETLRKLKERLNRSHMATLIFAHDVQIWWKDGTETVGKLNQYAV
jgi:hypothetical protein